MAPVSPRSPVPLSGVLSLILPTATESELLRALLCPADGGVRGWTSWRAQVGGLKRALERDTSGLKGLLPLLGRALRANGAPVDAVDLAYLRSAYLREGLRYARYKTILHEALSMLAAKGIPSIVLDGAALAETVYAEPILRHCHDSALLVPEANLTVAASTLIEGGLLPEGRSARPTGDLVELRHRSGLPVHLGTRLFQLARHAPPVERLWARSQTQDPSGAALRILGDADALLRVCGRAAYTPREAWLVWACDAWFILQQRPGLDWDDFLDGARPTNLALPLSAMLSYLVNELGAPVPPRALEGLRDMACRTNSVGCQIAVYGVHRCGRARLRDLARGTRTQRDRLILARWILLPSPEYARLVGGCRSRWWLPLYYLGRPLRYIGRRLTDRWRRPSSDRPRPADPGGEERRS